MKYPQDFQTERPRRYRSQELRGNPGARGTDLGLNVHGALNAMSIWSEKSNRAGWQRKQVTDKAEEE